MTDTNRTKMGDDASLDNDGDVTNVVDQFSDEIIGYDVKDVEDVSISDNVDGGDSENDESVNGDSGSDSDSDSGDSSDHSNGSNKSSSHSETGIATNFPRRGYVVFVWLAICMIAAFVMGIVIGNYHHQKKKRGHHIPPTFGNPEFANGENYPPGEGPLWDPKEMGPGMHVTNTNGHNEYYGDIPNNNPQQAAPTTEAEQYAKRKRHFTTLAVQWSGAAAVATPKSPSRRALDWILDEDPFRLTTADRTVDVQQRYIMAVFYFATLGEHWSTRRRSTHTNQRRVRGRNRFRNRNRRLEDETVQVKEDETADLDAEAYFLTYRDVCHWTTSDGKAGVFCDQNGVIVQLEFRDFGLGGTLPREFGYLSSLSSINVEYNDIEGTFPTHYGLMANLKTMKFENNQITGKIPTELAKLAQLEKLDLDGNYFTGALPTEIATLLNIVKIEIGGSNLSGSIPKELSSLNVSLQKLDLKDNNFSGKIPSELGSLTKLNYLDLENNNLTGDIPTELSGATSLEMLYLNGNDFAGSLDATFCGNNIAFFEFVADCRGESPEVMCSCCTSCCDSHGSNCTAVIEPLLETAKPTAKPASPPVFPQPVVDEAAATPASSVDSSKLKQILATVSDLSLLETKHTDQFKAYMWMAQVDSSPLDLDNTPQSIVLQKYIMTLIYISTNGKEWNDQSSYLTNAMVCDWKGLTCNDDGELVSIVLEHNNLDGTIVSEIGALGPSLRKLQLGMNNLHGSLPSEIGLLKGLKTIDVFDNDQITGTIPSELSIQSLTNIETIQLVGTGIVGNLDPLFCTGDANDDDERNISSNCFGPSVSCSCCQVCCDAEGENCKVLENNNN